MSTTFKLNAGFDKLRDILNPGKFRKRLNLNIGKAVQLNAKLVEKAIRNELKTGMSPRQSALSAYIKGSSKPGIDNADLFKAVTSTKMKLMTYFVGVLRTNGAFNIAELVHFGATIEVTPAMRGMFFMMWLVDKGRMPESSLSGRAAELYRRRKGGWKPLKRSTTRIVIPERRFVTRAMANATLKKKIARNFARAAQLALGGARKK